MSVLARCLFKVWPVCIFINLLLDWKMLLWPVISAAFIKFVCVYVYILYRSYRPGKQPLRECHPPPMLLRWRSGRQFWSSHLCPARRVGRTRVNNPSYMLNHSHGDTLKLTSSLCRWMTELKRRNQNVQKSRHSHVYRAKCHADLNQPSSHTTSGASL